MGEDFGSPIRSISNPTSKKDPDTFKGTYYLTTADDGACVPKGGPGGNDFCGVHSNSGVLNHWFYILTAGKSGTNNASTEEMDTYNVTGIGMKKSAQIAYFAERDYLTPNSTFLDARNATIQIAYNLYCENSPEIIAVTNAWNAVNVGDKYILNPFDISLKSATTNSTVACGATFSPSIVIENRGGNNITTATISYNIDGGTNTDFNWTGNLAPCSSEVYPFNIAGSLSPGTHSINVTVTTPSDSNASNNTKTTIVTVNEIGKINSNNTFENDSDNLISIDATGSDTLWQRGSVTKTVLTNTVAGNSKVYATKLSGKYPDKTTAYLVSKCYDLTKVSNPVLKFDMAFDLEKDYDVLYVEFSKNNGSTWEALGKSTDANWYNSNTAFDDTSDTGCRTCIGSQWTGEGNLAYPGGGTNATKRKYSYSLATFGQGSASPQSNMIFRFVFKSDAGSNADGVIIDNLAIEGAAVLGVTENSFEEFKISPNPSNGKINVKISSSEKVEIDLIDLRGRGIYNNTFSNQQQSFNQELDFSKLSKGLYILNVKSQGKKATKKILIE
jgi:bacillolysin